ncbi:globin-coupled sensor protein [Natronobacterium texcoconense]|uniref:Protoglobin n=1 Tax=Natronobacterium texcoconense TaxID=1095778 RepID=A0A1H1IMY9_NATTX|nr:globin-coupled sensor protein [Natronobacterium texcoconense]SDR38959.1 Protoglobin [Natronobacterium texcoconense]
MSSEQSLGSDGLDLAVGLDEDDIERRKRLLGFDAVDERRLADLESLLEETHEAVVEEFYGSPEDERSCEDLEQSSATRSTLKRSQRIAPFSTATGGYGREYFEKRARVGKLHAVHDVSLPRYVGQYGVYCDRVVNRIGERVKRQVVAEIESWFDRRTDGGLGRLAGAVGLGDDGTDADGLETAVREAVDEGLNDVRSLLRVVTLDVQAATEAYADSYDRDLEAAVDRHERLARDVEADVERPLAELEEASEGIARRAEAISQHTERQADSVEDAATEIDEISAAAEEVATVAARTREESERTERLAADGVDSATGALVELDAIEEATDRVTEAVEDLESRTDEIDETLERLDTLAQRTAMLASTAKIESSRSSADDDALAIIADEVRSFSEQTKADLEAIEESLEGVTEGTEKAVERVAETDERVDAGAERVRETVESFEEIHEAARSTAAGMDDLAVAADQQAHSIEATAESVDRLAESADRVAAAAESVAAASEQQTASLRTVSDAVSNLTDSDPVETSLVPEPTR